MLTVLLRNGPRPLRILSIADWFGSSGEPLLKRALALRRRLPSQEVGDANVFIDLRPMNALAAADQSPGGAFFGACMRQAGIPSKRRGDRAAVRQLHGHRVF